jgi:hypothetical protein
MCLGTMSIHHSFRWCPNLKLPSLPLRVPLSQRERAEERNIGN